MRAGNNKDYIVGVDIGSTTIKLVCFNPQRDIVATRQQRNDKLVNRTNNKMVEDLVTDFVAEHGVAYADISCLVLTGVGASFIEGEVGGLKTVREDELQSLGRGGLHLSGLDKALVVSLGTGSTFMLADGANVTHLGGSCLGAAAVEGLSLLTINERDADTISRLAQSGNLSNIDLIMEDISKETLSFLPMNATAAHFGKVSRDSSREDIARAILNMVFQTIALFSVFSCRSAGVQDIVLTGGLTTMQQAQYDFDAVGRLYGVNFVIPQHAVFAVVIGACLPYL